MGGQPISGVWKSKEYWANARHARKSGKFVLKFSPRLRPSPSDSVASSGHLWAASGNSTQPRQGTPFMLHFLLPLLLAKGSIPT